MNVEDAQYKLSNTFIRIRIIFLSIIHHHIQFFISKSFVIFYHHRYKQFSFVHTTHDISDMHFLIIKICTSFNEFRGKKYCIYAHVTQIKLKIIESNFNSLCGCKMLKCSSKFSFMIKKKKWFNQKKIKLFGSDKQRIESK